MNRIPLSSRLFLVGGLLLAVGAVALVLKLRSPGIVKVEYENPRNEK